MKLLIISHTPHYESDGRIVAWGPTVRELDQLAQDFDQITHLAALHSGPAPASCQPYQATNIVFSPLPAAGGRGIAAKLSILRAIPAYLHRMLKQLPSADAVHIRCPANISLVAVVLVSLLRTPRMRWIKYAGNWRPDRREAWSYRFQRWWLRTRLHRGVVTVNGSWPNEPNHVRSFYNPCLTEEELAAGRESTRHKQLTSPARLLYVGRVERAKGGERAVQIAHGLRQQGRSVRLDVVGDGPDRPAIEQAAAELGVLDIVRFHGWRPRAEVARLYQEAHFLLLPTSSSEGWPKVLSEAMAYGVVPIAGRISSIPQYLERFGLGRCVEPFALEQFVDIITDYLEHPEVWRTESLAGPASAELFSYSRYRDAVGDLFINGTCSDSRIASYRYSA